MLNKSIRDIMTRGGVTALEKCTLDKALCLMAEKCVSSVVLVDGSQKPLGIFTEEKLLNEVTSGVDPGKVTLGEITGVGKLAFSPTFSVADTAATFEKEGVNSAMVIDGKGNLAGVVSLTDILHNVEEKYFIHRQKVKHSMSRDIVLVGEMDSVDECIRKMAIKGTDCVIVTAKAEALGIFTRRDAVRLLSLSFNSVSDGDSTSDNPNGSKLPDPVYRHMSTPLVTVGSESLLFDACGLMDVKNIRRLVVTDSRKSPRGVLLQKDLVRRLSANYNELLKKSLTKKQSLRDNRVLSLLLDLSNICADFAGAPDDILVKAAVKIVESGEADFCSFILLDVEAGSVSINGAALLKGGSVQALKEEGAAFVDPDALPTVKMAMETKIPVIVKTGGKDMSPFEAGYIKTHRLSTAVFVPLIADNTGIGTMFVGFKKPGPDSVEPSGDLMDVFAAMAGKVAVAYERARLNILLKDSEIEYRELFENSVDIVFKTDKNHLIEDINPQYTLSTGHDISEWIGKPFGSLLTDYRGRSRVKESKACDRSFSAGEAVFKTVFGKRFFHISSWPRFDRNGNVTGNWHVAREITEQKENERELIATKEKAVEASRAKSTFLANMSHELKTPLTSIIGFGNLIMRNSETTETVREQSRVVVDQGKTLLELINNILDLVEAEKVTPHGSLNRFFIEDSIKSTILREKDKAKKKCITLKYKVDENLPRIVMADELKITRVLELLLDNAIKFTNTGGGVEVAVSLERRFIRFEVNDTGIGIDEKDCQTIFERFHQLDGSSTRRYEGMGMGLALAMMIVAGMGGTIGVKSRPGKGSLFHFTVPLIEMKKGN